MSTPIEILQGEEADRLLADPAFVADWAELCEVCPWATPFQSPAFAATWYRVYRSRANPVLVLSGENGGLQSLLPLAHIPSRNQLAVAGTWHAEYHAWLCAAHLGDAFPAAAFPALAREFPSLPVSFCFLPPNAPTAWLGEGQPRRVALVEARRRPLVQFGDGKEIGSSGIFVQIEDGIGSGLDQFQMAGEKRI